MPVEDLGVKYFSSSNDKDFKQDQKNNPQDYRYKIVRIFDTTKKALQFEMLIHSMFNVATHNSFYNRSNQTSVGFDTTGVTLSDEHKRKINPVGRKMSDMTKEKIRQKSFKECLTEEARFAMGKHNRGKSLSDEVKKKLSIANSGKVHRPETCALFSATRKGVNNPRAKLVDVYEYPSDKLIAKEVLGTLWCKGTIYQASMLLQTLKRDISKPYCFSTKNKNYNPLHYKGLYVVLSTF